MLSAKMQNKQLLLASVIAFLSVSAVMSLSSAQIGEFAGKVLFNVSIGSSETLHMTIFNAGNNTVDFQVQLPQLAVVPNATLHTSTATTPIVTVSPMSGTLQPREELPLNITVFVPAKNNTAGISWHGIVSAYEVSNANSGGAQVQTGVGKIITIVALPPQGPNYGFILEIVIIVVVIAAVAGAAYYMIRRSKKSARKPSVKPARRGARAARKRPAPKRRKPAARKRTPAAKKRAARRRRARR